MLRHVGLLKQAATIENALLAALETGIHTGDFGDPALPGYKKEPCNTAQLVAAIVDRLGTGPARFPAVPVPEEATPTFVISPRPAGQQVLRTFVNVVTTVTGCDIYLDTPLSPPTVAEEMCRIAQDTPFVPTLISNRGTQVWPTGSVYTECVDYYRVRFELKEGVVAGTIGQSRAVALMDKVAEKFVVCSYELLRTFDGTRGYSLAQGQ